MKPYSCSFLLVLSLYLLCFCNRSPSAGDTSSSEISTGHEENWQPLFNHENLKGWHTLPGGKWEVQQGVIIGTSPADEPLHGILMSNQQYSDFKLRVIFKILSGDSGLYFRVEEVDNEVAVNGFQAEIDTDHETGGLYETGGRAWVVKPDPEKVQQWMKADDWNELIVIAKGRDVKVFLNGHQTASLKDDPGRTKGYIGLQLHGGMEMHVMFKDVLIIENPGNMEI